MEYYRTDKGIIIKVKQNHDLVLDLVKFWNCELGNIVKHSKNIIDLIEVGDIVNGCEVVAEKYTYIEMNFINVDSEISYGWGTGAIPESEIKTILTHEMYEQNCYKVGEE